MTADLRLTSLSFSDIANMTLLGEESFYRCEPIDAEFESKDTEIERLRGILAQVYALANPRLVLTTNGRKIIDLTIEFAPPVVAEADDVPVPVGSTPCPANNRCRDYPDCECSALPRRDE